ncbi:MAG: DUF362 domain-containing protein [Candidatus Bathyarchaeales archaeon]
MSVKGEIGKNMPNRFIENGEALISKVAAKDNLKESILHAVNLIGGFRKVIEDGDEVLLKPNYNSADPPPASTDPEFLRALVELLYEHGAGKVVVGESSMQTLSTRKVMEKTGALEKLNGSGAEIVFFDEGKWVKVEVGGKYLKKVSLPERALRADKLVYCCCMKTHFKADFSLSLKLAVGFVKGSERIALHLMHLREKIADLNLVVHPNIIVMDGRKCFITGGPFNGETRESNVILASGDRVAMDVEAIKIIESFDGAVLKDNPWNYTQIKRAVELGLGAKSEQDYRIVSE